MSFSNGAKGDNTREEILEKLQNVDENNLTNVDLTLNEEAEPENESRDTKESCIITKTSSHA